MRKVHAGIAIFAALIFFTACTDVPTAPHATPPGEADVSADYVLKPVIVVGEPGGCDPTQTECDDDGGSTCITGGSEPGFDSVEGCPGGGTGAGGGAGGEGGGGGSGSGTGDGDENSSTAPSLANDMQRDTIPPVYCADPNNTPWQNLYCRATEPNHIQHSKLLQALDRIALRGPECAVVAQVGRDLLSRGEITFFVWQPGDAGAYGHPNTGIQMDVDLISLYDPVQNPNGSFEHHLVHEIDHVMRLNHIDAANQETPHTALCS